MACRALCRSVHRRTKYLIDTRSFSPGRHGELYSARLQAFAPLPSHLCPFSSSPFVCNTGNEATRREHTDDASGISEGSLASDVFTDTFSPVDLMASCIDTLHNFTGLPWWATISFSAVVLRALLFPCKVLQKKKLAEIKKLDHIFGATAKGVSQGKFLEEYRHGGKGRQEVSCPNHLRSINPGIYIQVPLVLTIIYSLRTMALEQHPGFITGGFLWFENLTVPGEEFTGAVLPLVVAATYFANMHVQFKGQPVRQGPLGTLQKAWEILLKCSTVLIFLSFYHLPQAVLMFSVPHSIMTLSQTMLFDNEKFVARVVGPTARPKAKDNSQKFVARVVGPTARPKAKDNSQKTIVLSSYEILVKDAGIHFTSGNATKAIELLEKAIEEEPEEEQTYALLGLIYKTRKDWVNTAIYYKQAILKGKTDNFKIAAYAECGLALLEEGLFMDCVDTMRPIKTFNVPEHLGTLHCYYASLVIFGRALCEAGLKDESQEIVQQAKELNKNHKIHETLC